MLKLIIALFPSGSSGGKDSASTFQHSKKYKHNNGKAEERSQASADAMKDKAKQNQPANTPGKTSDDETYFADSEDSDDGEAERLQMKRRHKAGGAGKEQEFNQTKPPPIRCEKCNRDFKTVEEREIHIKTSPSHFWCRKCEGIVEFYNLPALSSHYKSQHPELYCHKCDQHYASVEERKVHIKTSKDHFCCQDCDDMVEFGNAFHLALHYEFYHSLWFCQNCDHRFSTDRELFAHMREAHYPCHGCHEYFITSELLEAHRKTCEKVNPPKSKRSRSELPKRKPPKKAFPEPRERKPPIANTPGDHYAVLGISPHSPHEQVVKAAKEMRIKMHPDRLKRQGGLTPEQEERIDVEAALVGQAADTLSNPALRAKYDRTLRA